MDKRIFLVGGVVLLTLAAILLVFISLTGEPPIVYPPQDAKVCGVEENVQGQGYSFQLRTCMFAAHGNCDVATATVTRYTTEGDPITTTIWIDDQCLINVFEDSQDSFGMSGRFYALCEKLLLERAGDLEQTLLLAENCMAQPGYERDAILNARNFLV